MEFFAKTVFLFVLGCVFLLVGTRHFLLAAAIAVTFFLGITFGCIAWYLDAKYPKQ